MQHDVADRHQALDPESPEPRGHRYGEWYCDETYVEWIVEDRLSQAKKKKTVNVLLVGILETLSSSPVSRRMGLRPWACAVAILLKTGYLQRGLAEIPGRLRMASSSNSWISGGSLSQGTK